MTDELQRIADLVTANIIYTQKAILTTDEVCKYMAISKSTLYKMMMRKQIPYSQPNGKVAYFNRLEIEKWLMRNRVATADEISDQAQTFCARARSFNKLKVKGGAK